MLKLVLAKIQSFLIGSVILAVATGVALVAVAYGLYAVLRLGLSAAASAGVTAVVFAGIVLVCAVVLRRTFSAKTPPAGASRGRPNSHAPDAMKMGLETGAAVVGAIGELLASRRQSRPRKTSRRGR